MKKIWGFILVCSVILVFFALAFGKNVSISRVLNSLASVEHPNIAEVISKWEEELENVESPNYVFRYDKNSDLSFFEQLKIYHNNWSEFESSSYLLYFEKIYTTITYVFELAVYPLRLFSAVFNSFY